MNIMILDKKDITVSTDSSLIYAIDKKLPYRLIDTIIILSSVNTTTSDLINISSNGISIILLSNNYRKCALIVSSKSKNSEMKLLQYKSASNDSIDTAKWILFQKIKAHIVHLREHNIEIDLQEWQKKIDDTDTLDALLGVEGSFSKIYFGHYFSLFPKQLHKAKRSKRPPMDPLNATMSFFYTLFYNLITVRLISFGFEPGIGYLHRPFRDHNALASDILEVFRARINAHIYRIFVDEKLIDVSDFTKKGGVYLKYTGRKKIWQSFRDLYDSCESDIDRVISELRGRL